MNNTDTKLHYQTKAYEIAQRVFDNGETENKVEFYALLLSRVEKACDLSDNKDTAVRIGKLKKQIGVSWGEENGNLIFVIVRGKFPVTILLRRDNQNCTASALRCEQMRVLA